MKWEFQLTLSIVSEVELAVVAAVENRVLAGVLDASVPQTIGVGRGGERGSQVQVVLGHVFGELNVPAALGLGAGEHGGRGAGCESEDDGGELHDDGWLVGW
jgi:hypothetical protein